MKKEPKITVKSAFKIKEISIEGENPITFDERLSKRDDVLDKLLYDDDKNYNIIAGMNSGKTRGIVEHIWGRSDEMFVPAVLCVPLKIIVDQLYEEVLEESHFKLGKVHGDILDYEIKNYLSSPGKKIFVCVYDSLDRLFNMSEFNPSNYILVIDEMHSFCTEYDYRHKAIKRVDKIKDKFKKVICLTGTPEGSLYTGYDNVRFKNTVVKTKQVTYRFAHIPLLPDVAKLILSYEGNGKTVILLNDKGKIDDLAGMLRIHLHQSNEKDVRDSVSTLYVDKVKRNVSNPVLYKQLLQGLIPAEIKFLITTALISDSVNIKNVDIARVILVHVDNFWLKRQYVARFREGVKEVIDVRESNTDRKCNWFSAIQQFKVRKEYLREHLIHFEKIGNYRHKFIKQVGADLPMIPLPADNDFIYYDKNASKFKLSEARIGLSIVEDINNLLTSDIEKAKEYCRVIGGYKIGEDVIEDDYSHIKHPTELKPEQKQYFIDNINVFLKCYINDNKDLSKNSGSNSFQRAYRCDDSLDELLKKVYFRNNTIINILLSVYNYAQLGFPLSLMKKYATLYMNGENPKAFALINTFEFFFMLQGWRYLPDVYRKGLLPILVNEKKYDLLLRIDDFHWPESKKLSLVMLKKTVEDLNYKTNILTSCLSAFYQYSKKNNNILQYEGSAGEEDLKEANGLPTDNVTDNYYYPIFVVLFNYIRKWGNEDRFIAQKPLLKQLNELVIEEISDYGG